MRQTTLISRFIAAVLTLSMATPAFADFGEENLLEMIKGVWTNAKNLKLKQALWCARSDMVVDARQTSDGLRMHEVIFCKSPETYFRITTDTQGIGHEGAFFGIWLACAGGTPDVSGNFKAVKFRLGMPHLPSVGLGILVDPAQGKVCTMSSPQITIQQLTLEGGAVNVKMY